MDGSPFDTPSRVVGRYVLHGEIASGGMATVHLGRLRGGADFSKIVAIKRLYPHFARDPDFVQMFKDEARLSARIRHPNVVQTLDVVHDGAELLIVMEYVHGTALARLLRAAEMAGQTPPPGVCVAILIGVLHGLAAAHSAAGEDGERLGIVHRDVSPQNVLIGSDGVARVLDFGIAKAAGRSRATPDGQIKGKIAYMAPEQLRGRPVTRQVDIYAASVVLWETLTCRRLFDRETEGSILAAVFEGQVQPPSAFAPGVPHALDAIVMRGLAREPQRRFISADEMAVALETCGLAASVSEVKRWANALAEAALAKQATQIALIERTPLQPLEGVAGVGATGPPSPQHELTALDLAPSAFESGSEDPIPGPSRRRFPAWGIAGAAALAGGVALGALFFRPNLPAARSSGPAAGAAATGPSSNTSIPPPLAGSADAISALAASPTPPASVSVSPSSPVHPGKHARGTSRPAPVSHSKSCEPPYVVDAAGMHHMKPECL